jgi:RNA polymerase sigma factor (sigma-70 family)
LFLPRSPKVLAALSDDRLVEQVRRGNEAAFEAVYDRHHRGILSFCRHMLGSADEAEDAVQQTFISAYDALLSDERDMRLKAWLYTIARNRCLSMLRARREQPAELDEVPVAGLSEEVQQRSDLRDLLADLRDLPVDQRAALVLAEVGDLSHAEVGAVVGCEVAKVKSLVFQARSSLIESRRAREIPCQEIREQLATATGGVLRRGPLRRHLRACAGCAEFRDDVMRQRKALAAILPVVPTLGLKNAALSALGVGGGGGAGGAALGGGVASLLSGGAAVKLTAGAVLAGLAVGGGVLLDQGSKAPAAEAAAGQSGTGGQAWPAPASGTGPGTHVIAAARHRTAARPALRARPHKGAKTPGAGAPRAHARAATPSVHDGSKQHGHSHASAPNGGSGGRSHGHHGHSGSGGHPTSTPAAPTQAPAPQPAAPAPTTQLPSTNGHHGHHGGEHSTDHSGPPPYGNAWGHRGDRGGSHGGDGNGDSGDHSGDRSGGGGDGHGD